MVCRVGDILVCMFLIDFMCFMRAKWSLCLLIDLWNEELDGTLFYTKPKKNIISLDVNLLFTC